MTGLEAAFYDLLEPAAPEIALLGEPTLRLLAGSLAATARDAVSGIIRLSDCDIAMRRELRRRGYPPDRAAGAARRMVEFVA
ncbi:MAG: hypothetical protein HUU15_11590 [Candidatus Brocadiae bacterium]|nr:hypothetical protein [Candidatus Brocadiia bacterium]